MQSSFERFPANGPASPGSSFQEPGARELLNEYAQVQSLYKAAIQVMMVRLETLASDFETRHAHMPIHSMCSRVKTPQSIIRKLRERSVDISFDNAKKILRDIAGVRVICCYIDDMFTIANLLKGQDDLQLIEEKNYIQTPKTNGYRSLHLVLEVPVYTVSGKVFIPVEVQIRTVAMDFWASLEHSLRYKAKNEVPGYIAEELKSCADTITETDMRMQEVFRTVSQLRDEPQD